MAFNPDEPRNEHGEWGTSPAMDAALHAKVVKMAADEIAKKLDFDPNKITVTTEDKIALW